MTCLNDSKFYSHKNQLNAIVKNAFLHLEMLLLGRFKIEFISINVTSCRRDDPRLKYTIYDANHVILASH